MYLAILLALAGVAPATTQEVKPPVVEQAPRVADSYQPRERQPVKYTYNSRCVTTLDAKGRELNTRCGL